MTPEECAEYLRLDGKNGARLLANWRLAGGDKGPPFRKHGKAVVYQVADVDAWSERQRRTSTSERQTNEPQAAS